MLFTEFIKTLDLLKKAPLGGTKAQFQLAPSYRKPMEQKRMQALNPTPASVLIVFCPNKYNETSFILTKRADYKGHHAKQISFPGGKRELKDLDLTATAIRETYEEIGILIPKTNIIKQLTAVYIPPSNFLVHPFIGFINKPPLFKINHEVASTLVVSYKDLLNPNNIHLTDIKSSLGNFVKTPCFIFKKQIIWGATAMILSEIRELFTTISPK